MAATASSPRPRLELRDSASWYEHDADGGCTLVVARRAPRSEGAWEFIRCEGPTKAAAERAYSHECQRRYAVALAQANRRARWGASPGVVSLR